MQASDEPSSPDKESSQSLGARLRAAREDQGLALDDISAELRVENKLLQALEEERFDAFGAPVFARGFLKQYGARLGLDTGELLVLYERVAGEARVDITPSRAIKLRDDRKLTIWLGALLAFAAAALSAWWWLGRDVADNAAADATAPGGAASSVSEVTARPEIDEALSAPDEAVVTNENPGLEPIEDQAPDVPADEPVTDQAAVDEAATDPPPTNQFAADPELTPPVPGENQSGPTLTIVFNEDSWTEISDANGEQLFYALGVAGSRAEVPAARSLNLFFGNAAGVELSFGGAPVEIPQSARRGELAQFDFDPEAGPEQ